MVFGLGAASVPHGVLQDVLLIIMLVSVSSSFVAVMYEGSKSSKVIKFLGLYIIMEVVIVLVVRGPASDFIGQVANDLGPAGTGNQWRDTFIYIVFFLQVFGPAYIVIGLYRKFSRKDSDVNRPLTSP